METRTRNQQGHDGEGSRNNSSNATAFELVRVRIVVGTRAQSLPKLRGESNAPTPVHFTFPDSIAPAAANNPSPSGLEIFHRVKR